MKHACVLLLYIHRSILFISFHRNTAQKNFIQKPLVLISHIPEQASVLKIHTKNCFVHTRPNKDFVALEQITEMGIKVTTAHYVPTAN